jgi:hypothetical protein
MPQPQRRLVHHPLPSDTAHVERIRRTVLASLDLLSLPIPDTFLGRRTYKPFGKSEGGDNMGDGKSERFSEDG